MTFDPCRDAAEPSGVPAPPSHPPKQTEAETPAPRAAWATPRSLQQDGGGGAQVRFALGARRAEELEDVPSVGTPVTQAPPPLLRTAAPAERRLDFTFHFGVSVTQGPELTMDSYVPVTSKHSEGPATLSRRRDDGDDRTQAGALPSCRAGRRRPRETPTGAS